MPVLDPLYEIFSQKKMIRTKIGNLLGLQVLRVLLARAAANRRRCVHIADYAEEDKSLAANGYCVIPNFLNESQFLRVLAEYDVAMNSTVILKKVIRDIRGYIRETAYVTPHAASIFPHTYAAIYQNKRLRKLLLANEGRAATDFDEEIYQVAFWRNYLDEHKAVRALISDHSNSDLHADTFHTTIKAFFYLGTTCDLNGAHRYAPRSHRLSPGRLWFEYMNSIGPQEGSPRVSRKWLRRMKLSVLSLEYPANTLIVVNTFGFHQSGEFAAGRERKVIYAQYRPNPFPSGHNANL